jgi:hypothetical protein
MENQRQNCSSSKHSNIDAVSYCQQCKIYLCNKCLNFHAELFDKHILINLNKDFKNIFIEDCKKINHQNSKLEFFCKTHNILCCSSCITKIKDEFHGQHTDCNVCLIKNIKEEKKLKLKNNIQYLEDLSISIKDSLTKLKNIFESLNSSKEELKKNIKKIFIKIKNALNIRENELLFEVDEKFNGLFNENFVNNSEKLPKKIKMSLEKGKLIDKEWDNENKLNC